jgi:Uma2 family endonuclease
MSEYYAPEPDVVYVTAARLHLAEERALNGAPDVAVEIVSRDSRRRDNEDKRDLYERSGTAEYWIIDPGRRRADFLRLARGRYKPVALEKDIFTSRTIPGFWLDVGWLFVRPLPNDYDCLQTILAGPPPAAKPRKRPKK